MSMHRHRGSSHLRRVTSVLALLLFVLASIIHFPGLDTGDGPSAVSAAMFGADAGDDGKALVADHCHCVVAAPWPAAARAAGGCGPHDIPVAAAHALATLHLENDGPPPKA
jgi:hypothetical protein